jgi:hypothetical protein
LSVITPLLCNSISSFSLSAIEGLAIVLSELTVVAAGLAIGVVPGGGQAFTQALSSGYPFLKLRSVQQLTKQHNEQDE